MVLTKPLFFRNPGHEKQCKRFLVLTAPILRPPPPPAPLISGFSSSSAPLPALCALGSPRDWDLPGRATTQPRWFVWYGGGGRHQHLFSCCQFGSRKSVLFPLCQMCSNFSGISFPPVVVHVAQPSFWAQPRSLPERLCPGETSQLQTVCGADIIATDLGPMHGRNESWQRAVLCSALSLPPATCSHRTAPGTRSHSRWLQGWPSPTWCLPLS